MTNRDDPYPHPKFEQKLTLAGLVMKQEAEISKGRVSTRAAPFETADIPQNKRERTH